MTSLLPKATCKPGPVRERREAIAAYLFRVRGLRARPQQIMITSGSTQALWLIARLRRRENSVALVEDPLHRGLAEVIRRAGQRLVGIQADEHGLDSAWLSAAWGSFRWNPILCAVTAATPTKSFWAIPT